MSLRAKGLLAAEILVTYIVTRWSLRRAPLPGVVARLRQVEGARLRGPMVSGHGARLGRAVERTLSPLPVDSRCLLRSLVLLRMLARRGERAELVIAARPGEAADGFEAHAWVEVRGRAVLPPAAWPYGRLVTL
jgi:hypothetical protein